MVDSMIRLHDHNSTNFDAIGLCVLPDAMKCQVIEERNGAFELEMTYSVEGREYSNLMLRRLIIAKPNPFDDPQPFRIYEMSKPLNGIVTVKAEHISYDLSGYSDKPFTAANISQAMTYLKSQSVVTCPFIFETDKSTVAEMKVDKPTSIRSLLGGTEGSVLDTYNGGEYKFNRYNVKLWSSRGSNKGVSIRYGKNLTSLQQEENCANVYSHILPYYYSDDNGLVMLSGYTMSVPGTHNYTKILPVDLSDKFSDAAPSASQLQTEANKYIQDNNLASPKVSLNVSFVQLSQSEEYKDYALLENVQLCDLVNVEFPKLGVSSTAKCIKTVYNVLTGKYTSIELGDARTNLATTVANQQNMAETVVQTSAFKQAVEHMTKLITGGLGGYVVLHSSSGGSQPDEILVMDQPKIENAIKVWRWNKGGLGYSSTGYNGPFGLAMTNDGQIVASRITTGTLDASKITVVHLSASSIDAGTMSAARIKGGTLALGGTTAGAGGNGVLSVYDASNVLVGQWNRNGLYLGNISTNLSAPNTRITTAGAITTKSLTANDYVYVNGNYNSLLRIPLSSNNTNFYTQMSKDGIRIQGIGNRQANTIRMGPVDFGAGNIIPALYMDGRSSDMELEMSDSEAYFHLYHGSSYSELTSYGLYFNYSGSPQGTNITRNGIGCVGSLDVLGSFTATGSKNRLVSTKDYGKRCLYAYETPSPMFGDVGEGVIAEDGKCYVFIDPIYSETVSLSQYQIFLQKYGEGECYVSRRTPSYFIVEGTPKLSFGWEIQAKQFDYDQRRLDVKDYRDINVENAIDYSLELGVHIDEVKNQREVA